MMIKSYVRTPQHYLCWAKLSFSAITAAYLILAVAPSDVLANGVHCDTDVSTNSSLGHTLFCCDDGACDGEGPIDLSSNANLDLNGYDVLCMCGRTFCSIGRALDCSTNDDCSGGSNVCVDPACTECDYAAISMSSSSSIVKNTGSSESTIAGDFLTGVDCNLSSGSQVQDIRINIGGQSLSTGILDCAKAQRNVLIADTQGSGGKWGVYTEGVANTDFIRDNYLRDWNRGIQVTGSDGVSVDHNFIHMGASTLVGIYTFGATSSGLDVFDNIITGRGFESAGPSIIFDVSPSGTIEDNLCDPDNADCEDCIDDSWCLDPAAPFVLP